MAKKEFTYRGKKLEELKKMSIKELAGYFPARQRRTLLRGLNERQKKLINDMKKEKDVKTHCRNMIILPEMVGKLVKVHNGKSFVAVRIEQEMIGHCLGEFALTRGKVAHSAPGIGATRSSASMSVR